MIAPFVALRSNAFMETFATTASSKSMMYATITSSAYPGAAVPSSKPAQISLFVSRNAPLIRIATRGAVRSATARRPTYAMLGARTTEIIVILIRSVITGSARIICAPQNRRLPALTGSS